MESKKELASIIMQKEKLDMVDGKMVKDLSGFLNKNTRITITNITD